MNTALNSSSFLTIIHFFFVVLLLLKLYFGFLIIKLDTVQMSNLLRPRKHKGGTRRNQNSNQYHRIDRTMINQPGIDSSWTTENLKRVKAAFFMGGSIWELKKSPFFIDIEGNCEAEPYEFLPNVL